MHTIKFYFFTFKYHLYKIRYCVPPPLSIPMFYIYFISVFYLCNMCYICVLYLFYICLFHICSLSVLYLILYLLCIWSISDLYLFLNWSTLVLYLFYICSMYICSIPVLKTISVRCIYSIYILYQSYIFSISVPSKYIFS